MKNLTLKRTSLLWGICLMLNAIVAAGQSETGFDPINQKLEHILKSKINGTTYHLFVSLPKNYSPTDNLHYPVLYFLDGNLTFPIAHSARTVLDLFGDIEQIIIVGIDYSWERSMKPMFINRTIDFTPSPDPIRERSFAGMIGIPAGSLTSGGASVFLKIFKTEIIPFMNGQYKCSDDRGIAGHSLGGLFAGYCLLSATDLFDRFGINSPSFWWNNDEMLKTEKSFSIKNKMLPGRAFVSVGSLEGGGVIIMTAFADSLKSHNYKGLNLSTQIFEGETHTSVMPACISRTLTALYGLKK